MPTMHSSVDFSSVLFWSTMTLLSSTLSTFFSPATLPVLVVYDYHVIQFSYVCTSTVHVLCSTYIESLIPLSMFDYLPKYILSNEDTSTLPLTVPQALVRIEWIAGQVLSCSDP